MQRGFSRILAGAVCASLLAACGGGSAAVPVSGAQSHTGSVAIALTFPSKTAATKLGARHANYIPPGTHGVGIDYAPSPAGYSNTTADTKPMAGSPLVANTAPCGSVNPNGSYSCVLYLPAVPVGYNDFKVTLWDTAPAGCDANGANCNFTGATALSTTVNPFLAVKQGQTNDFSLGFAAQVDSVYVALSGGIVDGTASSLTATVTLKDPNGFSIVDAPSLYDKNGNALTVSLNLPVNGSGSLSFPGPSSTIGFTSVGSSSNTVNVNYDGAYQFASSGGTQPSVTASLNGGAAINGSIVNASLAVTQSNNTVGVPSAPQIAKITSSALTGAPSGYLALGSDGNLWLAETSKIAEITTNGTVTETAAPGGAVSISGIGAAGDGYLYFMNSSVNNNQATIGRFAPPNVASAVYSGTVGALTCCGADANTFVTGADGRVYFGDPYEATLDSFGPNSFSSNVTNYTAYLGPGGYTDNDVIAGPPVGASLDPSVCTIQSSSSAAELECFDTATHAYATAQPLTFLSSGGFLALGSDGALYAGENGHVERFTLTSGLLNAGVPVALPSNGRVEGMSAGHDGNIWFVENNNYVGKIDPASSAGFTSANLTEYAPSVTGSSAVSSFSLVQGPAPNYKLYFYDATGKNVYSITP